jgi:hypothetical protein
MSRGVADEPATREKGHLCLDAVVASKIHGGVVPDVD